MPTLSRTTKNILHGAFVGICVLGAAAALAFLIPAAMAAVATILSWTTAGAGILALAEAGHALALSTITGAGLSGCLTAVGIAVGAGAVLGGSKDLLSSLNEPQVVFTTRGKPKPWLKGATPEPAQQPQQGRVTSALSKIRDTSKLAADRTPDMSIYGDVPSRQNSFAEKFSPKPQSSFVDAVNAPSTTLRTR